MPIAETAGQFIVAGLELPRTEHARLAPGQHEADRSSRRRYAPIVDGGDRDPGFSRARIDQAQSALLPVVAAGIEDRHAVMPCRFFRHHVVHAGEEAVAGADVRQRLEVQGRLQLQAPVAVAVPNPARQSLRSVSSLQITGVEMHRRLRGQRDGDRPEALARVVDGVDAHRPRAIGSIDDSYEPLLDGVGSRRHQRDDVWRAVGQRSLHRSQGEAGHDRDGWKLASCDFPSGEWGLGDSLPSIKLDSRHGPISPSLDSQHTRRLCRGPLAAPSSPERVPPSRYIVGYAPPPCRAAQLNAPIGPAAHDR